MIISVLIISIALVLAFNPSLVEDLDIPGTDVNENLGDTIDDIGGGNGNNQEGTQSLDKINKIKIKDGSFGNNKYIKISYEKFGEELILEYENDKGNSEGEELIRANDTTEELLANHPGIYSIKIFNEWEKYTDDGYYKSGRDLVVRFKLNVTESALNNNKELEAFNITTGSN